MTGSASPRDAHTPTAAEWERSWAQDVPVRPAERRTDTFGCTGALELLERLRSPHSDALDRAHNTPGGSRS